MKGWGSIWAQISSLPIMGESARLHEASASEERQMTEPVRTRDANPLELPPHETHSQTDAPRYTVQ